MTSELDPAVPRASRRFMMPAESAEAGLGAIEALVAPRVLPAGGRDPQVPAFEPRPSWERAVRQEQARVARTGRPAAIVVAELHGLAELGARLGQQAADRVVPPVRELVRRSIRTSDLVSQDAAHRFHLLLPETGEDGAAICAARLQALCRDWMASGSLAVTLLVGVSELRGEQDADVARRVAEDRMHDGRRMRVAVVASPGEPAPGKPAPGEPAPGEPAPGEAASDEGQRRAARRDRREKGRRRTRR